VASALLSADSSESLNSLNALFLATAFDRGNESGANTDIILLASFLKPLANLTFSFFSFFCGLLSLNEELAEGLSASTVVLDDEWTDSIGSGFAFVAAPLLEYIYIY
jgi:hypothetical protein